MRSTFYWLSLCFVLSLGVVKTVETAQNRPVTWDWFLDKILRFGGLVSLGVLCSFQQFFFLSLHTFVHVALTKGKTSWCITFGLSLLYPLLHHINRDLAVSTRKKRIKNDKCVHSWLILTFDSAQSESNSVILQIGEGEPASLHVSNIDPSGKANNNGQILWFRGLNRIQQQVISTWWFLVQRRPLFIKPRS